MDLKSLVLSAVSQKEDKKDLSHMWDNNIRYRISYIFLICGIVREQQMTSSKKTWTLVYTTELTLAGVGVERNWHPCEGCVRNLTSQILSLTILEIMVLKINSEKYMLVLSLLISDKEDSMFSFWSSTIHGLTLAVHLALQFWRSNIGLYILEKKLSRKE